MEGSKGVIKASTTNNNKDLQEQTLNIFTIEDAEVSKCLPMLLIDIPEQN